MSTASESGITPVTEAQKRQQEFLISPLPSTLTSHIRGNAPAGIKELPVKWLAVFRHRGNSMRVVEVDIVPSVDDEEKIEGRVVVEVDVIPEMRSAEGVLHQAALVFLIDECSTLAMVVANAAEGRNSPPGVSCSINALFHGAATSGTKLRIVNRSLSSSHESNSGRSEVWNVQTHKLIASGTQLTMPPSLPTKRMR
ncbi:hypothetical protein BKA70DRAFT_1368572 [Coprinopsis sp. MPI-PUGE-AT-0042]|nr:hypothetical protein BKA70DRAFT_1368572 [Coprinopsis sp. MPI-PUGE-AT-0042]